MLIDMTTLLTEPAAATLLALGETDGATLSQLARVTGRSTSTIQRAIGGLLDAGVVIRDSPRGPLRMSPDAPYRALRELAEWQLGTAASRRIRREARVEVPGSASRAPSTITNPKIRAAWPEAIGAIVAQFDPVRIILFGSQARGDARPDSDVDLLVVFDGHVDRRERQIAIARTLAAMPFAKDVLVASAAEVGHPMIGTAMAEAFREGVTVYER